MYWLSKCVHSILFALDHIQHSWRAIYSIIQISVCPIFKLTGFTSYYYSFLFGTCCIKSRILVYSVKWHFIRVNENIRINSKSFYPKGTLPPYMNVYSAYDIYNWKVFRLIWSSNLNYDRKIKVKIFWRWNYFFFRSTYCWSKATKTNRSGRRSFKTPLSHDWKSAD